MDGSTVRGLRGTRDNGETQRACADVLAALGWVRARHAAGKAPRIWFGTIRCSPRETQFLNRPARELDRGSARAPRPRHHKWGGRVIRWKYP
eukprot:2807958-Prymnesium_polylepis.1